MRCVIALRGQGEGCVAADARREGGWDAAMGFVWGAEVGAAAGCRGLPLPPRGARWREGPCAWLAGEGVGVGMGEGGVGGRGGPGVTPGTQRSAAEHVSPAVSHELLLQHR